MDRAWYDFDGGYDETNNPFADVPEEYTKKKEEQLAKHAVKRVSAHQRQINQVRSCIQYMYFKFVRINVNDNHSLNHSDPL